MDPLNGRTLGRYQIGDEIGRGGMGVVYRAKDTKLNRHVALKVLPTDVVADLDRRSRFIQEAQTASQLQHPHIGVVYEVDEIDGVSIIAMELIRGEKLSDMLNRASFSTPRALTIAIEVAEGLACAHEAGVVHRDVKPANVMITEEGHAKIIDFGLAKLVAALSGDGDEFTAAATAPGIVMGTALYMSPEQARSDLLDHRSDVFSFGVMLYETLAGRPPFRGHNGVETLSAILHVPAPPLPPLGPIVSKEASFELQRIVDKCLAKDPADRYQGMRDVVVDLRGAWRHLETGATTLASLPPAAIPVEGLSVSRRRPPSTAGLAAFLVALIAVAVWWTWRPRESGVPPTSGKPVSVSVLVANFENRAREPLFDGLLEQVVGLGIEEASFVTTYPRRDALRLVPLVKPGGVLDEHVAQLLARREGIDRVVAGSISSDRGRFRMVVNVIDPADGRVTMTGDSEAGSKEEVLSSVGRLAVKIRVALGDRAVDSRLKEVETFTAGSLEAAHEYVRAQELQWNGKYEEALSAYQKAVQLDPTLGRAYAGLGAVSSSLGRRQEAEAYYLQALSHLDRMTDREKYRTRSGYFLLIRNTDQAREELEALVKQFPADSTALSNLAVASFLRRDMTRALELGRKASAIFPKNVLRRNNVALFALYAGEFATAEREAAAVLELNKDFAKAYLAMALAQLGQNMPEKAGATYRRLAVVSETGRDFAASGEADLAMYEGRLTDAAALLKQALSASPEGRSTTTTARLQVTLAEVRQLQGEDASAVKLAEDALARDTDKTVIFLVGRVLAGAGRFHRTLELAADLAARIDQEAQHYGKLLEGEVSLERGDARTALMKFGEAQRIADSWMGRFGLGRAYLASDKYAEAGSEFDRCLRRAGETSTVLLDDIPTFRFLPPVYYYVGRAAEALKNAGAIRSYQVFLAIKAKGDEQGIVADARRRVGGA